ncbi:MAG TPA: oxidoreductase [Candidatus Nanopelagicales bacterium]|nr:oxidoreductase [Candidatus Nanopelagicales bacterium]
MSRHRWTAADIPDLSGRRAVVTGANSGIGRVTALELARHGADVVLAVRDLARGNQALGALRAELAGAAAPVPGSLEVRALDLADLGSVRGFAAGWVGPLHLLVNNAGVMAIPRQDTADGFEMQLGTNHLGPFALTGLLLPALRAAGTDADPARVVTVSSGAHRMGKIDFADLQGARRYRKWAAYGQSKLANLLFTFELERRLTAAGAPVAALAAHPGLAATNLQHVGPALSGSTVSAVAFKAVNAVFAQSPEQGALPTLYAATVPGLPGGSYVGPDGLAEQRGHPRLVGTSAAARDDEVARRLWAASQDLTGVSFDLPA